MSGYEPNDDNETLITLIKNGTCAAYNIPTIDILNYCVPDFKKIYDSNTSFKEIVDSVGKNKFFETFGYNKK